jgi:hypothetical protein
MQHLRAWAGRPKEAKINLPEFTEKDSNLQPSYCAATSMQFELELSHTIGLSDFAVLLLPIFIVGFPYPSRR